MHQKLPPTFIEGTFKDWALEILTAKEVAHCGGSVGLDWIGLDRIGLGWVGLDWIGFAHAHVLVVCSCACRQKREVCEP